MSNQNNNSLVLAVVVIGALLLVVFKSFYIVRPDQFVVVTQFGDPMEERRDPGIYFLIPFVQDARFLDNRVRGWDDIATNTNTAELKPIDFTAFARWEIDPEAGGRPAFTQPWETTVEHTRPWTL